MLDPGVFAQGAVLGGDAPVSPFTAVPVTGADMAPGLPLAGDEPAVPGGATGLAGAPGVAPGPAGPAAAPVGIDSPAGLAGGNGLAGPAGSDGLGVGGRGPMRPGTQPMVAGRPSPADFADILPPVQYQPGPGPRPGPGRQPGHGPPGRGPVQPAPDNPFAPRAPGGGAARSRWPSAMVTATIVVAVGLSVVLPVVGTLSALALIVTLRAGELAQQRAVRQRSVRGAKSSDRVLLAAVFPWYLVRSLLSCVLLAPFALAAAVVVAGVTIAIMPGHHLPRAVAAAAGTVVAFYGFGPGSARPRRQLNRLFAAVATTRAAQAVALAGMTALALATLAAAASWPSLYWPAGAPGGVWHFGVAHMGPIRHLGLVGRLVLSSLRGG